MVPVGTNSAAPIPRHPEPSASATAQDSATFVNNLQINADMFWLQTNRLLNNPPAEELESRLQFHQDLIKFHLHHASGGDTTRSESSSPIPSPITNETSQASISVESVKEQPPPHEPKAHSPSEHATSDMMAKSDMKHEDLGVSTVEPVFKQSSVSTSDMAVTSCNFEASSASKAIANSSDPSTEKALPADSLEKKPTVDAVKVKKQLPSFLNKLPMIDKRPLDLYKLFRSVQMRGGFIEVITKKLWAQIGRELGYRGKIMTSLSSSLKSSYLKILYPFEAYLASKKLDEGQSPGGYVGPFSSVYTLRQFMEKDAKFQEYLINRYSTSFKRISQSIVTDPALEATDTFNYPSQMRQSKDEPLDKLSSIPLEKCAISVDKFEQLYWRFITNTDEPPSVNKLQSLQEGPELENGVSLPSTINGSGFLRLGDDLANFKSTVYNGNTFANQTAFNPSGPQDATSSSDIKQLKCEGSSAKSVRSSLTPWNLHNLSILPNSLLGAFAESDVNNQDIYSPALNIGMTFSTENWHTEDHFTQLCNYQFFGGPKIWYFIPPSEFDKFEQLVVKQTNEEPKVHINNKSWDFDSIMSYLNNNDSEGMEANKTNVETETFFSSLENMIPPYPDYNNERLESSHPQFQRMIDYQRSKRNPQSGCVTSLNQDCFISPSALNEAGIKYTYAIQNPGEFIIKFPKAYSASVSLGLNLSEEVNFATASWLDSALEGEKWINKQLLLPNFSLFKMLVNLAQLHESARHNVYFDSHVYQRASQQYAEMSEAEIKLRENVRAVLQATKREVVLEEKFYSDGNASIADDDLQNLYPSRIVLTDTSTSQSMYISLRNFLEYNHRDNLLFQGLKVELQVFCSDDKLRHYGRVLSSYSIDYRKWLSQVEDMMQENELLPLKSLKGILSDGEKIHSATAAAFFTNTQEKSDPLYLTFERELANLKTFVNDANKFVEECQQILSLKHQQRIRGGGSRRGKGLEVEATAARQTDDSADVLQILIRLINKIPMLNFACPEADQISDLQTEIENFERASRSFLVKVFETRVAEYLARESLESLNLNELEIILNEYDDQTLLLESKTQEQLLKIKSYSDIIAKYQEFLRRSSDPKQPGENSSYTLQDIMQLFSTLQESRLRFDEKNLSVEIQMAQAWSAEVASEFHQAGFRSTASAPSRPNLSSTIAFFCNKNKYSFAIDDNYMLSSSRLLYEEERGMGTQAHDYRQIYCVCREHEAGTMIECDTCKEWYHVQCIQEDDGGHFEAPENYLCPLCAVVSSNDFGDWMTRSKITVDRLQELVTKGNAILVSPNELFKLTQLLHGSEYAAQWMTEAVTQIKVSQDSIKEKVDKMRFYLRKSYGASVLLSKFFHDTLAEIRHLLAVSDEIKVHSSNTPTTASLLII
ncbi:PHD-type domain-containing protein [[Candida] zeylanoides]